MSEDVNCTYEDHTCVCCLRTVETKKDVEKEHVTGDAEEEAPRNPADNSDKEAEHENQGLLVFPPNERTHTKDRTHTNTTNNPQTHKNAATVNTFDPKHVLTP